MELQPLSVTRGCTIEAPRDTAVLRVVATLTPADSLLPIPEGHAKVFLFELARRLALPRTLMVTTFEPYARLAGARAVPREPGYQSLTAVVEMRLRRGAPPDEVSLLTSSVTPAFDAALVEAVREIARDGIGALPDSLQQSRRARVVVDTRLVPDAGQTVLFEIRAPVVAFDSLVSWVPGNPKPTHPRHLRERNVEGRIVIRFVVDAYGTAVLPSIRTLEAADPAFVDAAAAALMFSRFTPARVDGCPVASVVEMLYNFSLY